MKSVLLVELSTSHTEIIEPFVRALYGCRVEIAISEVGWNKLRHKNIFAQVHTFPEEKGAVEAARLINNGSYDLVVYNSAQGKNIRNLSLRTFFNKTPVVGFHHNPMSLVKSFTQKFINLKVKKYLLLAAFNREYVIEQGFPADHVLVFYPLIPASPVKFSENKIMAVPGVLEQDRRDYFGLVDLVKNNSQAFVDYKFCLLGNSQTHDGPAIRQAVKAAGLEDYFIFFDGYVPDDVIDENLRKAKFVMPLIHPNNRYFEVYLKTKISGAYNLAYAYQLPLLMHESFAQVSEFSTNCVFYNFENLPEKIHEGIELDHEFYKKFDTEKQSMSLRQFLQI